jgi:hypothetical protein
MYRTRLQSSAVAVSKVRLEGSPLARAAGWLMAPRAREAGKISTRVVEMRGSEI